jgi:DNA-directed RNA polymerase subunit RPC12/RpoP
MLPENGKKKKIKLIKCDKCRERFELIEEDIIKIGQFSYIECVHCGQQVILKK